VASLDQLTAAHGLLIAGALFLAGAGVPLPIMPTLLAAGALAAAGRLNIALVVAVSPLCLLLGDVLWFFLGRRFGESILSTLCRISLERDVCIRKTQDSFSHHGLNALLVSRFVPGLSTLASPMAGATGKPFSSFLVYDLLGSALYSTLYIALGYIFSDQLDHLVRIITGAGLELTFVLGAIAGIYILFKVATRFWLIHKSNQLSVPATDVHAQLTALPDALLVDLRGSNDLKADPFVIPTARRLKERELFALLKPLPKNTLIFLLCSCPNDATSTRVALNLRHRGYRNAHPIHNGFNGWRAANLPLSPANSMDAAPLITVTP
jgi:membrane protein DedA with SNARE-associated domain/rhodanese-related sulfurtransferase